MTRIAQLVVVPLLIASVLLISVLPQAPLTAPYPVTEGPVTTFLSLRSFRLLLMRLKAAANFIAGYCCPRLHVPQTAKPSALGLVLLC